MKKVKSQIQSLLQEAGEKVHEAVSAKVGKARWVSAYLDVRFGPVGAGALSVAKILLPDGSHLPLRTPGAPSLVAHASDMCRESMPADEIWYGVIITITPDKNCQFEFLHDPNCVDDLDV